MPFSINPSSNISANFSRLVTSNDWFTVPSRCKKYSEGTFLHTLLHSNTQKEDFWTRETSKSTQMSISVFVWFHSKVKYLCSLLYSSSSKEDFCKILLSSDEAVCRAANPTLKGTLLSNFERFLTNFTTIYNINVNSKFKAPGSFLFLLKSHHFSKAIHLNVCPELM